MPTPILAPTLNPRDIIQQEGLNLLLDDLRQAKGSFSAQDLRSTNEKLQLLNHYFENLKEGVSYLTDNRGENLRKMDPENLGLILEVIADSPAEARRLKELLRQGDFEALAKQIKLATSNPEKLIEIAEIMLMDGSIPLEIKNAIYKNLLAINNLLRPFHELAEKYVLVIPIKAFGEKADEERHEFAKQIGSFLERRTIENVVTKVVDGIVDLVTLDKGEREEKLAEIRHQIVYNRAEQSTLRQSLFLLGKEQVSEYREVMRQIVSLAGDENYLLEQERKYRRDPMMAF